MKSFQETRNKVATGKYSKNEELLSSLKNGDEKAFEYIFDTLHDKLLAFAMGYTRDKAIAKDLVQQSFIKLWEKRKDLAENTIIPAYMFTVCRNNFIDKYRQDQKKVLLTDKIYLESVLDAEAESEEKMLYKKQLLEQAIEKLPKKCKEVFLLKHKENLRQKEIAAYLEISEKTVEDHVSRAMRMLRNELLLLLITILLNYL
ncbi:RNA polymerase sigma factor [Zunongwangia pacifica]|uniref:RNA polymerase sigma-70 factor n=1 Tax=Zunongwangia pacifica TaxID=2911062 RepID=A0A9X2A0I0_9FLAO|nr:RNA polymerase sigma-70 factor [Zunongwangia pacifica]MCL6219836.1 RNA polymerase sigma-70 factor [Zunongwangia pacifica]